MTFVLVNNDNILFDCFLYFEKSNSCQEPFSTNKICNSGIPEGKSGIKINQLSELNHPNNLFSIMRVKW